MAFKSVHWQIRFWDKFKKAENGCWPWIGKIGNNGYGVLSVAFPPRWTATAHRLSWQIFNGPISHGYFVCHKCDVRHCVNPEHLFVGTHSDNMRDMLKKGRGAAQRGLLSGENSPQAKLNNKKVLEIRKLYSEGKWPSVIGRKYGISAHHAWSVAIGRNWAHI